MATSGATAVPAGSDVWTISSSGVEVVGGQKKGWTNGPIPSSGLPGACVSPVESSTAAGVLLYFGGDSRIVQTAGQVELCGSLSATSPPVVVQARSPTRSGWRSHRP